MATWTSPTIHATGDVLSVTDFNAVANNTTFLYQAPYGAYYNSAATSIPNNATTQVTLGGTTMSGYGFSVSSNNAIIPLSGIYQVSFGVTIVPGTASFMVSSIQKNGSFIIEGTSARLDVSLGGISTGAGIVSCSATNTLGLYGFQESGGALNTTNAAGETFLHAFFVGSV